MLQRWPKWTLAQLTHSARWYSGSQARGLRTHRQEEEERWGLPEARGREDLQVWCWWWWVGRRGRVARRWCWLQSPQHRQQGECEWEERWWWQRRGVEGSKDDWNTAREEEEEGNRKECQDGEEDSDGRPRGALMSGW